MKKTIMFIIIFTIGIICGALLIIIQKSDSQKSISCNYSNNKHPKIVANRFIDFENAKIINDNVVTNDYTLPIQNSGLISNTVVSSNVAREGKKSMLFILGPKEGRNEIMIANIPNNSIKYIAFSVFFTKNYKVPTSWNLFAQWWQGSPASPPLAFEIVPNTGKLKMRIITRYGLYQQNNMRVQYYNSIERNKWIDFVVEMRIDDSGGSNGTLRVWKDGKKILKYKGKFGYPNLYSHTNFRLGLYRDPNINYPAKIYIDNIRIGDRLKK